MRFRSFQQQGCTPQSSPNGDPLFASRGTDTALSQHGTVLVIIAVRVAQARAPRQKTALLYGAAAGRTRQATAGDSIYAGTMHPRAREHGLAVGAGGNRG